MWTDVGNLGSRTRGIPGDLFFVMEAMAEIDEFSIDLWWFTMVYHMVYHGLPFLNMVIFRSYFKLPRGFCSTGFSAFFLIGLLVGHVFQQFRCGCQERLAEDHMGSSRESSPAQLEEAQP